MGRRPGSISSSARRRAVFCTRWQRRRAIPSCRSPRSSAARIPRSRPRRFCRWRRPGSSRWPCSRVRSRRITTMTCAHLKTPPGCTPARGTRWSSGRGERNFWACLSLRCCPSPAGSRAIPPGAAAAAATACCRSRRSCRGAWTRWMRCSPGAGARSRPSCACRCRPESVRSSLTGRTTTGSAISLATRWTRRTAQCSTRSCRRTRRSTCR